MNPFFGLVVLLMAGIGQQIVDRSVPMTTTSGDQPFGPKCYLQPRDYTIRDVIGTDVSQISVDAYDHDSFSTFDALRHEVEWLIATVPENHRPEVGTLHAWSEATMVQAKLTLRWPDGTTRPLHIGFTAGAGYAHFQSRQGCEYWARVMRPKK